MLAETDVRNKEGILKRKSVYMQLRNQIEQLDEIVKDRNGTIETLERQLVQSGIKQKVGNADMAMKKDVMETEAAQAIYREKLKNETNSKMKELGIAFGQKQKEISGAKE